MGAVFVDEVNEIPVGALTVFSAHGVSAAVEDEAATRSLDVIDATCPLVRKVHSEGKRYIARGYDVILIGHAGHVEVEGTIGQIGGRVHLVGSIQDIDELDVRDERRVAYITQTTLSVLDTREIIDALRERFPEIVGPNTRDICFATQNRQLSVLKMVERVQALIVIGSQNSSNSNRLREIGANAGVPSYLIDEPAAIQDDWLRGVVMLGLTAGASAPESLVQATLKHLAQQRDVRVETLDGVDENVEFRLPKRLEAENVFVPETAGVPSR